MIEGAEYPIENEAPPEAVAPMADEDEPAELEELAPVSPAELAELEHVDSSGTMPNQRKGQRHAGPLEDPPRPADHGP